MVKKPTTSEPGEPGPKASDAAGQAVVPLSDAAQVMQSNDDGASDPAPTVVVTAVQEGRWRIGRQFGREPVSIPAEDLTEVEFAALTADPMLIVQVVEAPH